MHRNLDSEILHTARRLEGETFHFTAFADSRGRMYTNGYGLNAQGTDKEKGLLTFANKVPVGDAGIYWLKVNAANQWGEDKLPIADRASWTERNADMLARIASDPVRHREWQNADSPWQFLAAALEVVACDDDPTFESGLPVPMDATCSGAQILAAMARDRAAASKVNLTASDTRADVYMEVAEAVKTITADHPFWGREENAPDRALAKKPTMTSMYNAGKGAFKKHTLDILLERAEKRGVFAGLGGLSLHNAQGAFLASHEAHAADMAESMAEALKGALPGPMAVMTDLKRVAAECHDAGYPMEFTTGNGFTFRQAYRAVNKYQTHVTINRQRVQLVLQEYTERMVKHRAVTASAPNVVHCYDALLLQNVILALLDVGVSDFMMIHDSYAVHAANVPTMHRLIRQEFVNLFEGPTLHDLYLAIGMNAGIDLGEPPIVGDYNVVECLTNEYMFS